MSTRGTPDRSIQAWIRDHRGANAGSILREPVDMETEVPSRKSSSGCGTEWKPILQSAGACRASRWNSTGPRHVSGVAPFSLCPRRRLHPRPRFRLSPPISTHQDPLPKKCLAMRSGCSCSKTTIEPMNPASIKISSFPHPSLPPDPLTPRRQSEFWPSTVRRAQKQFHSKRFLVIFFLLHRLASHFSVSTPSFPAVFLTMFLTPSGMQA